MKIGELSRRSRTSIRMLRYYEGEGLLTPVRGPNGYRDYDARDVETVRRIRSLGTAGMTLPVIRQFLPCALEDRGAFEPCDELKDTLRRQIALVEDQVAKLADSRALLADLLDAMERSTP
ncbi:MerR family transcriptional regulator [Paenirhodobacter sp.]|uniref:MerR family transcriptional regulator n=1 Tax=Paenirhodobacter sp. TaxID=1965326 RepID=UPI003B4090D2